MSIETLVSEALMENCRVTGRGLCSLLAFWRAYRKVVPVRATMRHDTKTLKRQRQLWDTISEILDLPDERAIIELGRIVNAQEVELNDIRPFIIFFASTDQRKDDPVYKAYYKSVYVPFQYASF